MKVYSCPADVPAPEIDFSAPFDLREETKREEAHQEALKAWLVTHGYTGKHTGRIYCESVADGAALYMFGHGPTAGKSILIHLPYGDAWESRNVAHIPATEIIRGFALNDKIAKISPIVPPMRLYGE